MYFLITILTVMKRSPWWWAYGKSGSGNENGNGKL